MPFFGWKRFALELLLKCVYEGHHYELNNSVQFKNDVDDDGGGGGGIKGMLDRISLQRAFWNVNYTHNDIIAVIAHMDFPTSVMHTRTRTTERERRMSHCIRVVLFLLLKPNQL